MSGSHPTWIAPPKPENAIFINQVFTGWETGFTNAQGEKVETRASWRDKLGDGFDFPDLVSSESAAAIKSMTDSTFKALFGILDASISQELIDNKANLERRAVVEFERQCIKNDRDELGLGPFTHDQVQAYVMFDCQFTRHPNWRKLTELYNDSTDDQQQAIHQYFVKFHGISLKALVATTGPNIEIPKITSAPRTKEHYGDLYLLNEDSQRWLREDAHHSQYKVCLISKEQPVIVTLVAGAPTLEEAAAKATVVAQKYQDLGPLNQFLSIDITYRSKSIMEAFIFDTAAPGVSDIPTVKLRWSMKLDQYRARVQSIVDGLQKVDDPTDDLHEVRIKKLSKILKSLPRFSHEDLQKKVLSAERAVGVQWAKVYQLEDDLGL